MEPKLVTARAIARPESFDDEEVNLYEHAATLWRHRLAIIVAVTAVGFVTFVASRLMTPTYEATARLAVSASKIADTPVGSMTALVPYYKAVLESPAVAQTVIDKFQLDKPPYNLSSNRFLEESISIDIERDANIIVARSRFPDAALAASVVNQLVDDGIAMAVRLSQGEAVTSRDQLKTEVDQAEQRMVEADRRREAFMKTTQIEVLREDVDSMLAERLGLLPLLVHIQGERARLTAAREQLAQRKGSLRDPLAQRLGQPPLLDRRLTATPSPRTTVGGTNTPDRPDELPEDPRLSTAVKKDLIDVASDALESEIAASQARLAGFEKEKADLANSHKLTPVEVAKLNELYTNEAEMARIQTAYDLTRSAYVAVVTRYEQARTQVLERSAQLQILHRAIPPERPIAPRPLRYTALAMAVAFIIAAAAAIVVEITRRPTAPHSSPV